MDKSAARRALLLTVGTGDTGNIEDSLLAPLRKSIQKGEWARVILIPSALTEKHAQSLLQSIAGLPLEIRPLPQAGLENDVDACFAHFDNLIGELRAQGFESHELVADFTRGTKAMSAALVLAAVRHDISRLRYIHGERDSRGMVMAGTEVVSEVATAQVTGRKQVDLAYRFFRDGDFAAALNLLPDPSSPFSLLLPQDLLDIAGRVRPMIQFYAHWDRLDYRGASKVDPGALPPSSEWARLAPTMEMQAWVRHLAEPFPAAKDLPACQRKAGQLRLLAADLLANGERRIRDAHFEDAVVRGYRVLELTGQTRLFDKGLDSASIPPDDPEVIRLKAKLEKKRSQSSFGMNSDGTLNAPRLTVARLLKEKGDPLAERLIKTGDDPLLKSRNHSVLIHGFAGTGGSEQGPLRKLFRELEQILLEESGEAARNLAIARSLDFSRR
jgi:CRISPR-associated protein (TIGR02710 family)